MWCVSGLFPSVWAQHGGDGPIQATQVNAGVERELEVVFEPVTARYLRLVGYSEVSGQDDWANAAEIRVLQASDGAPLRQGAVGILEVGNADADESRPGDLALDGDLTTAWIAKGQPPHHFDLDMKLPVTVSGLRYVPSNDTAGSINRFAVFVSEDGVNWGDPLMRGVLVPREDGAKDPTMEGAPDSIALTKRTFAPPGMVIAPVAIDVDERNRVYVAETYRYDGRGVVDNRGKSRRELDDLQTNTLEEREGFLRAWLADGELQPDLDKQPGLFANGEELFTKFSEKVSLLEDADGDGRADHRKIFAEGFNGILDGTAAGVLVDGKDVYFACIPNVYCLTDEDGDDLAEGRKILSHGYGVRTGWFGHDLHGLTWGPDGRLYFSMADRGYHVKSLEGEVFHGPGTGGVFRCWPDGSQLELVANGLRNPQELAFDDYGNLFTGDNNCDAGDKARLVQVVEGGNSGWNMSVQSLADRGPWLRESMWELRRGSDDPTQPAWMLPPLAYLNSGPSGFARNPARDLMLPRQYDGYFFLCDYRGGRGSVQAFRVDPKGASFTMSGHHTFHDGPTVSDVAFGYDGKLYVSEWGPGWGINRFAKIYTLAHEPSRQRSAVIEMQQIMHQGFVHLTDATLATLLGHADQRIRIRAQRELAKRRALPTFAQGVKSSKDRLTRMHSLWGLGQIARDEPNVLALLEPVFADADELVRALALRLAGDARYEPAGSAALDALAAVNHRQLQFHAAYAVGKLAPAEAMENLLRLVQSNSDEDVYLRHATVMGLSFLNQPDKLLEAAKASSSASVRLAAVLVLRRTADSRLSDFLSDESPLVVTEAARAIYDQDVTGSMADLAEALRPDGQPSPVANEGFLRRALEANLRLGGKAEAGRLCQFAQDISMPYDKRLLALEHLIVWDSPPDREGVWGRWYPVKRITAGLARGPARKYLPNLLQVSEPKMQALAQRLDSLYGKEKTAVQLAAIVRSSKTVEVLRVEALNQLAANLEPAGRELFISVCSEALADPGSAALRAAALLALARVQGEEAKAIVLGVANSGQTIKERQAAVKAASLMKPEVAQWFFHGGDDHPGWLPQLASGALDSAVQLDVFEAAETSNIKSLRNAAHSIRRGAKPEAIHRLSLHGGDPVVGKLIYETNQAAQCTRCHAIEGKGGDIGPNLDGVGKRQKPEHLLQSVVDPQAEVTKGFGVQTVTLNNGEIVSGTLISESDKDIVIRDTEGEKRLPLSAIKARSQEVSGMPPAGLVLKPRELRDLLSYLQELR